MVDSVYRTRSLGVAAEGLPDQYADGKAATVWELYIGSKQKRTAQYKEWLVGVLRARNCRTVLDVACGTGVDSMLLVDEGFKVISTDASDKMLKYALKDRWQRRKDPAYDQWIIEEANWLTLPEDLEDVAGKPEQGFDAVICLGNSFAHLPDFEGKLTNQKAAIRNFKAMLKPGGLLLIDHRNYDYIVETGSVHAKNVYYNSDFITDIKCSTLFVNAKPTMVTLDYEMDMAVATKEKSAQGRRLQKYLPESGKHQFRLSYYPHRLKEFTETLDEVFSADCKHEIYADFKPVGEIDTPAYYIHVVTKKH